LYSVLVLGPFTSRVYVTYHFWTPICKVLGYWRHRSVCYTSLFTTPLVVTTISQPSDVVSRSGPGSSLDLLLGSSLIRVSGRSFDLSSVSLFSVRVSSLLFSVSLSKVKITLRLTVCQSVSLGVEPHLGPMTRYLLLFDSCDLVFVGRPLWREDGSVFCICCWPLPAQSLGSESLGTRDHIILSQIWDFPFRRLLRLAGSRWGYLTSPPHASLSLSLSVYLLPLKQSVCAWDSRHLPPRFHFPSLRFPTIWLIRNS
jgi:hypothetical protein